MRGFPAEILPNQALLLSKSPISGIFFCCFGVIFVVSEPPGILLISTAAYPPARRNWRMQSFDGYSSYSAACEHCQCEQHSSIHDVVLCAVCEVPFKN